MKEYKGSGASLTVYKDKIIIKRFGVLSFLTQGSKGDKEIFIKNITAIQLKKPGFTKGFIQFSLSGETASKGGAFDAVKDENSIMIGDSYQYAQFEQAKSLIEQYISERENPATIVQGNFSKADEIRKLAELKAEGFLSDEEFEVEKMKILNS